MRKINQRYFDFADYNVWVNIRLIHNLIGQDDELLEKELIGSSQPFVARYHIFGLLKQAGFLV